VAASTCGWNVHRKHATHDPSQMEELHPAIALANVWRQS
jgi:hypothetical protein